MTLLHFTARSVKEPVYDFCLKTHNNYKDFKGASDMILQLTMFSECLMMFHNTLKRTQRPHHCISCVLVCIVDSPNNQHMPKFWHWVMLEATEPPLHHSIVRFGRAMASSETWLNANRITVRTVWDATISCDSLSCINSSFKN